MTDFVLFKRLYDEMRSFRGAFWGALILYLPVTLLALAQPYLIGVAVEHGFEKQNVSSVTMWASLFLSAVILHAVVEMGQLYLMQWSGLRLVKRLRERLFAKIQQLSMSYFDHVPLGRTLTRVTNDVEAVSELFSSGAVAIFGDMFFVFGTLVMLFAVNARLSLDSMILMPLLAFGLWLMRKWMRHAYHWVRAAMSTVNIFLQEYLSGMQTVQSFAQIGAVRKQFDEKNHEYMVANRRAIFLDAAIFAFVDFIAVSTTAVVLWAGLGLREQGMLQLGVMVTFIEALNRFFMPIREFSNKFTIFQSALVSGERIFEILDQPITVLSPMSPVSAVFKQQLAFENVSFGYEDKSPILSHVNFSIRKGERVALVGHTGAGKSTITKLATRFYDVTSGQITFDGVDIRLFELSKLRQFFNVVPQEVFLFSGTLRDNLRYGHPAASDEHILAALDICQAKYLMKREGGLDAPVSYRGHNFSLGERQLLALARALIANPEILILDEATASIDTETERHLQSAIVAVIQNRTALIVAHRLSTIRDCDRILVFHKGALVEQGTHDELIAMGGTYAKLSKLKQEQN